MIELDEKSDSILTDLARDHGGDLGLTVVELLNAREGLELIADESEAGNEEVLSAMRDRSAQEFAQGRSISWESIKERHKL